MRSSIGVGDVNGAGAEQKRLAPGLPKAGMSVV